MKKAKVFAVIALFTIQPVRSETLQGGVSDALSQETETRLQRPAMNAFVEQSFESVQSPLLNRQLPQYAKPSLVGDVNQFELSAPYSLETVSNQQLPDNHGQRIVGVIGCKVDNFSGLIIAVFPPSNLNMWNIHRGDRVLGYNNHRFVNGRDMVREGCMGPPGSVIEISVLHDGQAISMQVPRVDSRVMVPYDRAIGFGNSHYQRCAAQTKIW